MRRPRRTRSRASASVVRRTSNPSRAARPSTNAFDAVVRSSSVTAMASRDGPRLPPPNSDPNTTATSSGQTIVKKNAARTRNSILRSLSAIASTAAMVDVLVKRRVMSVADGAAGEMQEDLLQRRRRHLELGRHGRAAGRGLAIELGERIARLDALFAVRRAE